MKMDSKRRSQKYSRFSLYIILSILIISAPFLIFLSSFSAISFDPGYYHEKFIELGVYGNPMFEEVDLMGETENLLFYLKHGEGNMTTVHEGFFNQRETSHLKDVRELIRKSLSLRRFFFFFSIIMLLLMFRLIPGKDEFSRCLAKYLLYGSSLTLLIIIIGIIPMNDFDSAFTGFHDIFFEEDTWVFDQDTDHLVNMFPERFFRDIAHDILGLAFIISLIGLAVGALLMYRPLLSRYYRKFISKKE